MEGCASARRRAHVYFPCVFFDDAIAHGKPEARTSACGFCGEERIENPVDVIARNSRARIDDFDFDAAIVGSGANLQQAAARHGVPGI